MLIGAGSFVVAWGIGMVTWRIVAPDEEAFTLDLAFAGAIGIALVVLLGLLAGWFGRERDEVVVVAAGFGASAALVLAVVSFIVGEPRIAAALVGAAAGIVAGIFAAIIARLTWWIGDAVCELRGLPNGARLTEAAFPEEFPGVPLWTTEAGPTLRQTLDALAARIAPGAPVDARAIGVLVGVPRERPAAVVLAADRLGIQTVDLKGSPTAEPVVVENFQLAEASIRSEAVDGSARAHVNAFDDIVELRTDDDRSFRIRLPYGTRGAGTTTGGPDVIRAWVRATATSYR